MKIKLKRFEIDKNVSYLSLLIRIIQGIYKFMIQKYLHSVCKEFLYLLSQFFFIITLTILCQLIKTSSWFKIKKHLQSKNSMKICKNWNRILFFRNEKSRTSSLPIFWASSFIISRLSYNGRQYLLQNIGDCHFDPI